LTKRLQEYKNNTINSIGNHSELNVTVHYLSIVVPKHVT